MGAETTIAYVPMGQAKVARDKKLQASDFCDCSMFLIKNTTTGEQLMMHCNPEDGRDDADGVIGISPQQKEVLLPFLQEKGAKVGLELRNIYYDSIAVFPEAVGFGKKILNYLADMGVEMDSTHIPFFTAADENAPAFDVMYDPDDDHLSVWVDNDFIEEKTEDGQTCVLSMHPFSPDKNISQAQLTQEVSWTPRL